jgi:hypothetical protein
LGKLPIKCEVRIGVEGMVVYVICYPGNHKEDLPKKNKNRKKMKKKWIECNNYGEE